MPIKIIKEEDCGGGHRRYAFEVIQSEEPYWENKIYKQGIEMEKKLFGSLIKSIDDCCIQFASVTG